MLTFHFCLAKNLFIFSLDRLLVRVSSLDLNAAIQGWARACSQVILRLINNYSYRWLSKQVK